MSGGSVRFAAVLVVLVAVVVGGAVEVLVARAEVVGALVTAGLALCWLLEQEASAMAATPTFTALRKRRM